MTFTIRTATPEDAPALGRLGAMLVAVHHAFDPERFLAPGPQTDRGYGRFLTSQIGNEEAVVLVADEDGGVCGYVYGALEGHDWMSLRGPAGMIHDILVDPASRRRGIARALLERALKTLTDRGAPRIVLSSATQNAAAQALFASFGFRRTMIEMTRERPD